MTPSRTKSRTTMSVPGMRTAGDDQRHRQDHAEEPEQVHRPVQARRRPVPDVVGHVLGVSRRYSRRSQTIINRQQNETQKSQGPTSVERPVERYAVEVSQKEWGIAGRKQAAADVRDQEDEEDHRMPDMLAVAVGLEQRPDQDHRGAGRSDQARQQGPGPEDRRC